MIANSFHRLTGRAMRSGADSSVTGAHRARRRVKLAMTLAAALSGGSMLSACDTRLKDAFVGGTKYYLFEVLLNQNTIVERLFGEIDATDQ